MCDGKYCACISAMCKERYISIQTTAPCYRSALITGEGVEGQHTHTRDFVSIHCTEANPTVSSSPLHCSQ